MHHFNSLTIEGPGAGVLVKGHVYIRACNNDFCYICIEFQLVAVSIVTNYVECSLEPTGTAGEKICVICDTDCSDTDWTKLEAKVTAVQTEKTRIYVYLKMSTSPNVSLSVAFVFSNPPS